MVIEYRVTTDGRIRDFGVDLESARDFAWLNPDSVLLTRNVSPWTVARPGE